MHIRGWLRKLDEIYEKFRAASSRESFRFDITNESRPAKEPVNQRWKTIGERKHLVCFHLERSSNFGEGNKNDSMQNLTSRDVSRFGE